MVERFEVKFVRRNRFFLIR